VFDSSLHSAGREHTAAVALLAVAFIFIPALVAVSQPLSYATALSASALCVTLAWFQWKRARKVSTPTTATERKASK
jgi:hypothetical protein